MPKRILTTKHKKISQIFALKKNVEFFTIENKIKKMENAAKNMPAKVNLRLAAKTSFVGLKCTKQQTKKNKKGTHCTVTKALKARHNDGTI